MLILNNGVPKSGSIWVQAIVPHLAEVIRPSSKWQNSWKSASVDPDRLEAYLASGETVTKNVFIKTHIIYSKEVDYLLSEKVAMFVSYRNIPDSVLSYYHHQVRHGFYKGGDIQKWMDGDGYRFALRAVAHRLSWVGKKNVIMIRYEDLLTNGNEEIMRMANFLGVDLSTDEAEGVLKATQVKLGSNEKPREGEHIRTAGRSRAREEIPEKNYNDFLTLEQALSSLG